ELLREKKKVIAVTGSHGKTTASALLSHIFNEAGTRPTAAIGGEVFNFRSNFLVGEGSYFIIEADESDGSFLKFYPDCAVLLNIDREHLDYFKDISNAMAAYKSFIGNVKKNGCVYYNADDKHLNRIFDAYCGRSVTFGMKAGSDVKAIDITQSGLKMYFKCLLRGEKIAGTFSISLPGSHNITNALAAIAVAVDAGIDFEIIKRALASYKGVKRRFEIKNTGGGIMLVEDYAHHPAEIKAVLRACAPFNRNIIAVFQPHRYTRTKDLFEDFLNCFKTADYLILTDIYAASEKVIKGFTAKRLFAEMKRAGAKKVECVEKDAVAGRVKHIAKKGDIVLILGAGDIGDVAAELEAMLS
ncbi:MAG: UDP-N-acetylmuramate--L-alanine ligase, partial [Candidatus Omnitrophota bacterium]|nr:UDP-N-acetylmuramate--L-alanine ligase [Candidatus Omnitrophota bacterium]